MTDSPATPPAVSTFDAGIDTAALVCSREKGVWEQILSNKTKRTRVQEAEIKAWIAAMEYAEFAIRAKRGKEDEPNYCERIERNLDAAEDERDRLRAENKLMAKALLEFEKTLKETDKAVTTTSYKCLSATIGRVLLLAENALGAARAILTEKGDRRE